MAEIGNQTTQLGQFRILTSREMASWLERAVDAYFFRGDGENAFLPFQKEVAVAERPAQGLGNALGGIQNPLRATFVEALCLYVQRAPLIASVWEFVADLAWRLDASDVVAKVEERIGQTPVLVELARQQPRFPEQLLDFLGNVSPAHSDAKAGAPAELPYAIFEGKPHVALFRRVIFSGLVPPRVAGLSLVRLCAIDPNNWLAHLSATADLLERQFTAEVARRGPEKHQEMAELFANEIYDAIGPDRLMAGVITLTSRTNQSDGSLAHSWLIYALTSLGLLRWSADDRTIDVKTEIGWQRAYLPDISTVDDVDHPEQVSDTEEPYDWKKRPSNDDRRLTETEVRMALGGQKWLM